MFQAKALQLARVASVTSSAPPLRNSCFSSRAKAAVSSSAVLPASRVASRIDVHRSSRLAQRLEERAKVQLYNSVRRQVKYIPGTTHGFRPRLRSNQDVIEVLGPTTKSNLAKGLYFRNSPRICPSGCYCAYLLVHLQRYLE